MSRHNKQGGRPTKYTSKIGNKVCQLLREGMTLRQIAKEPDMPKMSQILRWRRMPSLSKFCEQYERALVERAEMWEEEIIDIADNGTNDYMEILSDEGDAVGYKVIGEAIKRSDLRVNTRKWLMARRAPKVYGDKSTLDLQNSDRSLQPVHIYNLTPQKADDTKPKA